MITKRNPSTALILVLALAGCAVNPATGKKQLSLISEQGEIEMGRSSDPDIVSSLGLYDDAKIQSYIQDLGGRLAAASERADLKWTFRVVDDPVVNAFAVPGGFIYVTRGLMTHLNSEAELAGVVGHEIGHVTARHSVNQLSKAQLASVGLGLGMILKPELARYGDLAQTGLQLLFLKYGRDDERQADDLGLRYMTRSGYDPSSLEEVFTVLDRVSQAQGAGRVPAWLSTHPNPGDRKARIEAAIAASGGRTGQGQIRRDEYLQLLDGMVFGPNPREGFFKDGAFLHPEFGIRLAFPASFKATNQKQAVVAVSPAEDAVAQMTLSNKTSARAAADEFFQQQGVKRGQPWRREIHGFPAVSSAFQVQTEGGTLAGLVAFVEFEGKVFRLLGYTTQARWQAYAAAFESSLASFDRLTDPKALSVQPMRLDIVRLNRDLTREQFLSQHPTPVSSDTVALINHLDTGEQLRAGTLVKRVIGDSYAAEIGEARR